jgi:hypothetical protein
VTVPESPVTVLGRWFPADIVIPGRPTPWNRVYALATTGGLHVWARPSDTADWSAGYTLGPPVFPTDARSARNGFDVPTTEGLVVITLGSGCRCGTLGRWPGPTWATTERARR